MSSKKKPNIIVVLPDEGRAECLGPYGNNDIKTPHLNQIAKEGVVFKNCFCTFPVCTPSRYSFLTGLYANQHMGISNHSTLPNNLPKFPEMLKKAGYHTTAVGKMHYTPTYQDVGFDEMRLAEQVGPGRWDDEYHRYLKEKGLVDSTDLRDQVAMYRGKASDEYFENFGTDASNLSEEDYPTTWIGDRAVEDIEQWDGESPNFLMVGFIKPHHPFDVPEPWASLHNPEELSILPGWVDELSEIDRKAGKGYFPHENLTEEKIKMITAKYYGAIAMIDHQVGRMVEKLKEKGMYDNTMIVYTGDHGDYMGYHHMCLKSNYMYDPVVKVPLIVKYPNSEHAGKENEGLVSLIDLTGMILETGDSMVPQSMWNTVRMLDPEEGRDFVYSEHLSQMGKTGYMIRSETRKLLVYRRLKDQFFDLEKDPHETENLIDEPDYQDEVREYRQKLFEWLAFETISPLYLDEGAPIIDQEYVPTRDDGHRKEMKHYMKKRMIEEGYYEQ